MVAAGTTNSWQKAHLFAISARLSPVPEIQANSFSTASSSAQRGRITSHATPLHHAGPANQEIEPMAVPKSKVTRMKRGHRRSTDALKQPTYVEDKESGELRRPHHIDLKSGKYRGRQILEPQDEY